MSYMCVWSKGENVGKGEGGREGDREKLGVGGRLEGGGGERKRVRERERGRGDRDDSM